MRSMSAISPQGSQSFTPLVPTIGDDSFGVVDNVGDKLLVQTNRRAPNWRVVLVDPANPEEGRWTDVLPERAEPLQGAGTAGGKLFATYLKDVTTCAYVHGLDGTLEHEIALPGPGAAAGFGGSHDDTFVFYTFNSLSVPPTIYRYDIASRTSQIFRRSNVPGYDPEAFVTTQVFYPSKDGTRVPMFLVHRKGLTLDGHNPTLLYGYGGFNIVVSPTFSAARLAILERGVVFASANLRGGGEYGESWHQHGMKLRKQNVFDDFIAAAEWLVANKYTSPAKLAIQGGSNGGLLVGAVMNQRPELFRVGIPQVGRDGHAAVPEVHHRLELDRRLRFERRPRRVQGACGLLAVAQHQARHCATRRRSSRRPITTIAWCRRTRSSTPRRCRSCAGRENPVLIRIETKSGHGPSNLTKQLETTADVYAFMLYNLGVA